MQMKTCKLTCKNAKNPKLKVQKMQEDEQRKTKLFYTKNLGLQEGAVIMWHLQPNLNFSWLLNLETLTQVRGQTLPSSQIFILLKMGSHV
jgi:hypothetical protein